MSLEVNFSDLSNRPVETVRKLQQSADRALRVRRRGEDEDLVLTTASRAEQAAAVASTTATLFLALMEHDDRARTLVTDILPKAYPWVRFLPKDALREFVVELVDTLEAAASLDNPAPVAHLVAAWRSTAEAYADPELLAALRREGDDFGAVAEPPGVDS
ncbi:hypothetical protein B1813_17485 [Saccharomonospora piscinae]|uniref:Prevent-host-death family protein n=1 Tax=Saccharomonospora piscinae TaxID=687388 RepID=A0A1V8ZZL0_SACPI|nr:hypothetical protein [Saccharomonospora piscinae]OQO90226.1 hypothetical protein B1813_17485 [Saccharomonospora piscinae]TLW89640.1 hypothetical protein FFT09_21925 [Saccharomonospora piscinae]